MGAARRIHFLGALGLDVRGAALQGELALVSPEMKTERNTHVLQTILAAAAFAVVAFPALSQQCAPREKIAAALAIKYGEAQLGRGVRTETITIEIWVSMQTGTWTALQVSATGIACIVASGTDWDAAPIIAPTPAGEEM